MYGPREGTSKFGVHSTSKHSLLFRKEASDHKHHVIVVLRCILHLASVVAASCNNRSVSLHNLPWAQRNANWKGQIFCTHPSHPTLTLSDSHTHTARHSLSLQKLWGKGSLTLCSVCVWCVETGTEQQSELRLCDPIWNGRESHSCSCSLALRGSHSDRGQSQGQRTSTAAIAFCPQPWLQLRDFHGEGDNWIEYYCARLYEFPILSGARMRMKELSLRQDPDLRKELALLARGCDFVLPSRFKKRLRAFQQGQAGVCLSVPFTDRLCRPVNQWAGLLM